jgi:hypothetical protein
MAVIVMGMDGSNETMSFESGGNYWWLTDFMGQKKWSLLDLTRFNEQEYLFSTILPWIGAVQNNSLSIENDWIEGEDGIAFQDLVYNDTRDYKNLFDLYIPKDASKDQPTGVILLFRGIIHLQVQRRI